MPDTVVLNIRQRSPTGATGDSRNGGFLITKYIDFLPNPYTMVPVITEAATTLVTRSLTMQVRATTLATPPHGNGDTMSTTTLLAALFSIVATIGLMAYLQPPQNSNSNQIVDDDHMIQWVWKVNTVLAHDDCVAIQAFPTRDTMAALQRLADAPLQHVSFSQFNLYVVDRNGVVSPDSLTVRNLTDLDVSHVFRVRPKHGDRVTYMWSNGEAWLFMQPNERRLRSIAT